MQRLALLLIVIPQLAFASETTDWKIEGCLRDHVYLSGEAECTHTKTTTSCAWSGHNPKLHRSQFRAVRSCMMDTGYSIASHSMQANIGMESIQALLDDKQCIVSTYSDKPENLSWLTMDCNLAAAE